jgi:hypothetical protein
MSPFFRLGSTPAVGVFFFENVMTNELQIVTTALTQLGPSAKQAFFWWVFADKILPGMLVFIFGMAILVIVWKIAKKQLNE